MDFSDKKLVLIGYNLLDGKFTNKNKIFRFNAVGIKVLDLNNGSVFDLDFKDYYIHLKNRQIDVIGFDIKINYTLKTSDKGDVYLEHKCYTLSDALVAKTILLFYKGKRVYGNRMVMLYSYWSLVNGSNDRIKGWYNIYIDLDTFDLGMSIKGEIVYWKIKVDFKDCKFVSCAFTRLFNSDTIFNSHILNGGMIIFDKCVYVYINDIINSDIIIPNGIEKVIVDSDNSSNRFRLVCLPSLKEFIMHSRNMVEGNKYIFSSKSKPILDLDDFGSGDVEFYE